MIFAHGSNMASIPATQNYPFFNGHVLVKREVESADRTSGTTGSDDSYPEARASGSVGHMESDPEADTAGPADKEFEHTVYDPTSVKHRRRTTAAQLEILDAHFAESPKPDMDTRRFLSKQLGMTVREVQVWFQNRRAKQKKIDSRAHSIIDSAPSNSITSPAFLTAPQQLSSSSYNSSNGYSGYSTQSVPSLAPSYGNAYTSSSYGSLYTDAQQQQQSPYGVDMTYYSSALQPQAQISQPHYQQQQSYFPDVRPSYVPASYGYNTTSEENALSPKSYFATVQAFNNGQDRWSPNQTHFPFNHAQTQHHQSQDRQHNSVSVSPVSSRGSSHDETAFSQRRRSMIPHALSNLSGLSIMPSTEDYSTTSSMEPSYIPGQSTSGAVAPLGLTGFPGPIYETNQASDLPTYQRTIPTTYDAVPSLSPSAVNFPVPAQPMMSMADGATFASGIAIPQSYASMMNPPVSYNSIPTQSSTHQLSIPPFGTKQNFAPLPSTEAVLQMSATLAARRQSMTSYPEHGLRSFAFPPQTQSYQTQQQQGQQTLEQQRQPAQSGQDMLSSIPKSFNMIDESALPLRRASTSVLQNNAPPLHMQQYFNRPDPLAASRQAILDDAAQSVLPIVASPATPMSSHQQQEHVKTSSPARNGARTPASSINPSVALDDLPILGGLRRGSIPKKIKGATTTYSPYPQIHLRHQSSSTTLDSSKSILQE